MTEHRCEQRVLMLTTRNRDADLCRDILGRAGLVLEAQASLDAVCRELDRGVAMLLLPEETVATSADERLVAWLHRQPPWSDLPVLVLAAPGADSTTVAAAMDQLGNVTVLERPIRIAAFVSAVRSAQRARQRQYQLREHLLQLRDADRRKDEFLAILAHELRNPLAPISNSLYVLRLTGRHDPATTRVSEMLERQVDHMVRLVDDLLEVSRITRGKVELRREPVDIADVLRVAIETSRPLLDAASHELSVHLPPQPLVVHGDRVRLAQVFANLLNNAAKYTDPHGHVHVAVEPAGAEVAVTVSDDGRGITPELLPRVFDLFMQGDRSNGCAASGLGIGLTLVHSLVGLHGGDVSAHSDGPGRGARFVVRLPLAAAGAPPAPAPTPAPPAHLMQRALVVDDNRDAAESLAMLLRLLGIEVRVAFGAEEAIGILRTWEPAAVLLDIGMPGMDGHELARCIRADGRFASTTLIALTGWGQHEDRMRSRMSGFDHHLVKPADLVGLQRVLRVATPQRHNGNGLPSTDGARSR